MHRPTVCEALSVEARVSEGIDMSTRIGSPSSVAAFAKPACQSFCSVTEVTPDRSSPLTHSIFAAGETVSKRDAVRSLRASLPSSHAMSSPSQTRLRRLETL